MRSLLWNMASALGIPALFRWYHRNKLTIVLYHGVAPVEKFGIYNYRHKFISPRAFDMHLEYFAKHYTVLKLDEGLQRLQDNTLPPYSLVITFDDGYRNFYDHALPALRAHSMPATIFLTSGFVLRQEPLWVDRLEYVCGQMPGITAERTAADDRLRAKFKTMSPQAREVELADLESRYQPLRDFSGERSVYAPLTLAMIQEMTNYGITLGAHTKTHPILSTLTPQDIQSEIGDSLSELRAACGPISPTFAYPNGQPSDITPTVIDIVKDVGFTAALTTIEGLAVRTNSPFEVRRITLDGVTTKALLASATSGFRSKVRGILH